MPHHRSGALTLVAAIGLAATTVPAHAQGRGGVPDPVEGIVQLKPDLYFVPGAGANTVVRVTPEGLIVIDTKNPSPAIAAALQTQIASVSKLPVRYVINTHHHPDHTGNNQEFVKQGAVVVGLERLRLLMTTDDRTKMIEGPPTITFPRDYSLTLGGATVEARFLGASHTGGDTVVYLPDKRFVMVSDSIPVANPTPGIGFGGNGGSAVQVPGLLERILALDWDVALAGRGRPMTRSEVQAFKGKWDTFMARVRDAVSQGATKETLASLVKQDDLGWSFSAAFFGNLYDELQENPRGEPRL